LVLLNHNLTTDHIHQCKKAVSELVETYEVCTKVPKGLWQLNQKIR